jgi:hypothetical protein
MVTGLWGGDVVEGWIAEEPRRGAGRRRRLGGADEGGPAFHPKGQRTSVGDPGFPPQGTKNVRWGPRLCTRGPLRRKGCYEWGTRRGFAELLLDNKQ